ncbi:hypothetical protein Lmor_1044 [Legionella moravica]|uniref:Transmembrane protein n=1 Tax=Legionella moravica TaxID=39962 RepID=A0A378JWE3_9GAMM|nr:hypothetical protein [Legionella moravica]KTD35597.1 hypothetical protein Lmor_1044 [Legionella moravica]STX62746.1 Uncharacterised protein [Legionella moravica]
MLISFNHSVERLDTGMKSLSTAWQSYSKCRSKLWWPLSFLLLTPLAALIAFGVIIPLGLESLGFITFKHPILNFIYLTLAGVLVFFSLFPLLDGLYKAIFSYLDGEAIDENSGFKDLYNSANTGIGLFVMFILIALVNIIGASIPFLKLPIILITYPCIIFTPLLTVTNNAPPYFAWRESIKLAIGNWRLTLKIYFVRLLTLASLMVPILLMMWSAHLPRALFLLVLFLAPIVLVHNLIKVFPFYFFYPAYEYKQTLN